MCLHVQLLAAISASTSVQRPLNTFDCIVSDVRVTTWKQCIIIATCSPGRIHILLIIRNKRYLWKRLPEQLKSYYLPWPFLKNPLLCGRFREVMLPNSVNISKISPTKWHKILQTSKNVHAINGWFIDKLQNHTMTANAYRYGEPLRGRPRISS